jgi:hypothetical protein
VAGRDGVSVAPRTGMDDMPRISEEEFIEGRSRQTLEKEGEAVPRRGHARGGRDVTRGNRMPCWVGAASRLDHGTTEPTRGIARRAEAKEGGQRKKGKEPR